MSGGAQEKQEREPSWTVPPALLIDLMHYYDSESEITLYAQYVARNVFDGQLAWHVAWGTEDSDALTGRPVLFNTPSFRHALRVFLERARAYLRVVGAVPLWYEGNIGTWLRRAMNASSPGEREALGLPFGVLEASQCVLGGARRSALVEAQATEPVRGRQTVVYNLSMQLEPVERAQLAASARRVHELFGPSADLGGALDAPDGDVLRAPKSVFYGLQAMREALTEAQVNLWDADFAAAHPRVLLTTETPTTLPPEQIAERDLYEAETTYHASLAQQRRQSLMTMQEATQVLQNSLRLQGIATGRGGTRTARTDREERFARPDPLEDAYLFEEFTKVAQAREARVLNDYATLRAEYHSAIKRHMGILMHQAAPNKNAAFTSTNDQQAADFHAELDDIVRSEQALYSQLFGFIYAQTFGAYDMAHVDATLGELDTFLEAREALRRHAATAPKAAAAALVAATPPPVPALEEPDEGVLVAAERAARVSARALRPFLAALRSGRTVSAARLVFDQTNHVRNLAFMETVLQLNARDQVEPRALQALLTDVFGRTVQLREPPKPDPPKAAAVAAPPDAKQKGTDETPTKKQKKKKKAKDDDDDDKETKPEEGGDTDKDKDKGSKTKKKKKKKKQSSRSSSSDDDDDDDASSSSETDKPPKKKQKKS